LQAFPRTNMTAVQDWAPAGAEPHSHREPSQAWKPLLDGELREAAWKTAAGIAEALCVLPPTDPLDVTLANGAPGQAIFHAYWGRAASDSAHLARAEEMLDQTVDGVSSVPAPAALYRGLTGIGWVVEHLRGGLRRLDADETNEEIDDLLGELLLRSPWPDEFDLVDGLIGFGVYALERLPHPAAVVCLERIVDRLAETAVTQPEGLAWWTDPIWFLREGMSREELPKGYYDLGSAHGNAGVIACLGRICAAGVAVEKARPLLDGAVEWLLAQRLQDAAAYFPYIVAPHVTPQASGQGWCRGDLGIAANLLWAARCVNEPEWERVALTVACHEAERSFSPTGTEVSTPGLCHGAAGLGHLFNRLYQATHEVQLAQAARHWFQKTLDMRRPGCGIGGYTAWWGPGEPPSGPGESGVMTGAAGIALALLAACTTIEPNWDRMFLVSLPPC
jgi:lantibiotic biosynthesis protein